MRKTKLLALTIISVIAVLALVGCIGLVHSDKDDKTETCEHIASDWIIDNAGTCLLNGSKHKECKLCHTKLITETILAPGHALVQHDRKNPTCTESGWNAYQTCSRCNYTTFVKIDPLGHDLQVQKVVPATCTSNGTEYKKCSRCGFFDAVNIGQLSHNYVNGICTECTDFYNTYTSEGICYRYNVSTNSYDVVGYDDIGANILIPNVYDDGVNGEHPVTKIKKEAFASCAEITGIILSDNVTSVGQCAFAGCGNVEIILIGSGLETFEYGAFLCADENTMASSLTNIIVSKDNKKYHSRNNCIIETDSKTLVLGCKTSLIPNDGSVTKIGEYAFMYCAGLTSIDIPNTITSIEKYAFMSCFNVISATIPASITEIGKYAFYGCPKLIEVYNKSSFNITAGSDDYGEVAYYAKNVFTKNGENKLYTDDKGFVIYPEDDDKLLMGYIGTGSEATIPYGITEIYEGAFFANQNVNSIIISESVKNVGEAAFWGCSATKVVVSDSVTNLGQYAFYCCNDLREITIGRGITNIKDKTFWNCNQLSKVYISDLASWCQIEFENEKYGGANPLSYASNLYLNGALVTDLVIPEGVESISDYAFYYCTSLTSVTLPSSITHIGNDAFAYCIRLVEVYNKSSLNIVAGSDENGSVARFAKAVYADLDESNLSTDNNGYVFLIEDDKKVLVSYIGVDTELIVPDDVTTINYGAFSGNKELTSIILPKSITSIGPAAFSGCVKLAEIEIPDSVTNIGASAFSGCVNLSRVILPKSITKLEDGVFMHCNSLSEVVLPDSITSIGWGAFYNCTGLMSINIPDKVVFVDGWAFEGCTSLKSVHITDISAWCGIEFEDNPLNYAKNLYLNGTLVSDIEIPEGVTSIGYSTFNNCDSLTSVIIPNSVTSIGRSAFSNCTNLTSVNIGNAVTSIGSYAFRGCESLTSVIIPDSVTSIGESAFYNCTSLTDITIGNGVKSIECYTFSHCESLTSVIIPDSVTSIGYSAFSDCTSLTNVTIGENVASIGSNAFVDCESLTSIVIPNSVTSIGYSAFSNCTGLTNVTIGENVTSIGYYAFMDCESLTNIVIPGSVACIENDMFSGCIKLERVIISEGVKVIEGKAFYNCGALKNIIIPDSVTNIESGAFNGCGAIESITIPFVGEKAGVTSNDTYQYSFGYIFGTSNYIGGIETKQWYVGMTREIYYIPSSLKSVTVTGGYIPYGAFYNCSNLTNIIIGDNVTSICDNAFYNCSSLTDIIIGDNVTSIGQGAFDYCNRVESITIPFIGASKTANNGYDEVFGYIFGYYTSSSTSVSDDTTYQYFKESDNSNKVYYHYHIPKTLKTVIISDSATKIPQRAFYNCANITNITIGKM